MRRGEIWTVAGAAAYAGKPRPAVIIQDDRFDANEVREANHACGRLRGFRCFSRLSQYKMH